MVNNYDELKGITNKDGNNRVQKNAKKEKKKNFFTKNDTLGMLDYEEVNDMANRLISWYRIKIVDGILTKKDNKVIIDVDNYSYNNYKKMNFEQLLKRNDYLYLLKCKYETNGFNSSRDNIVIKLFTCKGLFKNKVDKTCFIYANSDDGRLLKIEGDNLLTNVIDKDLTNYNLEDICLLLEKKHIDDLNYNNLKLCIMNRQKSILTRNKIINKVCSDLISGSDNVEYGIFRASDFLKDINKFLNLNLGVNYLEGIIKDIDAEKMNRKKHKNLK